MGKAKPAKHTAAEIAAKVKAATTNMGGGKAGLQDRKGGAVGHAKYMCPVCKTAAPDLKSMQVGKRASCLRSVRVWTVHMQHMRMDMLLLSSCCHICLPSCLS
jgi:hypothetical protein